jgi:hypothetical protein
LQQLLASGSTLWQVLLQCGKWWVNQVAAAADKWINLMAGTAVMW